METLASSAIFYIFETYFFSFSMLPQSILFTVFGTAAYPGINLAENVMTNHKFLFKLTYADFDPRNLKNKKS
jgi:hypothetical protein